MPLFPLHRLLPEHVERARELFDAANRQGLLAISAIEKRLPDLSAAIWDESLEYFCNRVLIACVGICHPDLEEIPRKHKNRQARAVQSRLNSLPYNSRQSAKRFWKMVLERVKKGHTLQTAIGGWIITEVAASSERSAKIVSNSDGDKLLEMFTVVGGEILETYSDYWKKKYRLAR